jgi:hypothetical protein
VGGICCCCGMVVVEKDKIVVEMEKIVVENNIVDMDDMMFEDCREVGFHKWVLSNLVEKVGFEPVEEAMPTKEKGHSMCFVHNLD